jgi:flagellar hook-associated protein 1 FlgK
VADMLNVALSGLRAFQTALDTTSHNIANVSTPGYSRQRVDLVTQTPQGISGLTTGSGVNVTGINRNADDLLSAQMRRASSGYSRLDAYASRAGELNNLFADSQTGLSAALQKFTNALQSVANTPSSTSSRQVLLSEANGLVNRLQTYESRLDDIDTGINEQLRAEASAINTIAQNIAELNAQIARSTGNGTSPPNDLLDARDAQLADLATRVDVSVVRQDDGAVNVFIGKGQPLVLGNLPSKMITLQDGFQPDRLTLAFQTTQGPMDVSGSLSGGTVGGLLNFRREMLDPARNELGRMAVALTQVTNAQHRAGQDLYGDLGGDFFSVGGVQSLGANTNTGSATLNATRTNTGQLTTDDYIVRFDSGAWRVQRAATGEAVPFTVGGGGELQFDGLSIAVSGTAQSGDRFLVKPAGNAIDGLTLLVTDPARIAAAAPVRTGTTSGNGGSGVISAGEVLDPTNADLRDPVTIRFTGAATWEAVDAGNTVIATGAYTAGGNIDVNGWRVQVSGAPATGDSFTVASNVGGVGDNRNALKLAAVLTQGVLSNGTESLDAAASRVVSSVGVSTNGANASLDAQKIIYEDSKGAIDSLSGVNLDEEAANLLRYQQAYQAAAQAIRVAQTIFDTIIASVSR